jgi:hypothetical protein
VLALGFVIVTGGFGVIGWVCTDYAEGNERVATIGTAI